MEVVEAYNFMYHTAKSKKILLSKVINFVHGHYTSIINQYVGPETVQMRNNEAYQIIHTQTQRRKVESSTNPVYEQVT